MSAEDLFGQPAVARRAMHGHEQNSRGQDEWLTPPHVIDALGPFDLDPCAPIDRPWPTAARHYTVADNGLRQPWEGLVWLNPPYSNPGRWLARLHDHGNGIALLFARTETVLWHRHVWPRATRLLFLQGRLRFHRSSGAAFHRQGGGANAGAPSALIAFGPAAAARLDACRLPGYLVTPIRPSIEECAS